MSQDSVNTGSRRRGQSASSQTYGDGADLSREDSRRSSRGLHAPPISNGDRSRGNSLPPPKPYGSNPQHPIKQAVNSAVESRDVSSQLSPDLIAQITEAVMQNLKASGINTMPSLTPVASAPQYMQPPPTASSIRSNGSPDPLTSAKRTEEPEPISARIRNSGGRALERSPSPARSQRRDDSKMREEHDHEGTEDRSATLERIWQALFDEQGAPTPRLGQFLRGLANHIIEDFEPKHSIVITPQKMLRFYEETKQPNELYPWSDIFGGKMTLSSISHLYRDLKCQQHFVQRQFNEKPNLPCLTPLGFECWMTHVIRGHPEVEYQRFQKVVMNMPINNADFRQERFPKELCRRLFPKEPNIPIQEFFEDSVLADPVIELIHEKAQAEQSPRQSASQAPQFIPPVSATSTSPPLTQQSVPERRSPQAAGSDEDSTAPGPIERERKPYSAQPGQGRVYDNGESPRAAGGPHPRSHTVSNGARPEIDRSSDPTPYHSRRLSQAGPGPVPGPGYDFRTAANPPQPASHGSPAIPIPGNRSRSPMANANATAAASVGSYNRSEVDGPPSSWHSSSNGVNPRAASVQDDSEDEDARRKYSRENRRYVPDGAPVPAVAGAGYYYQPAPPPPPVASPPQQQMPQQPPPPQQVPVTQQSPPTAVYGGSPPPPRH